MTINDLVVGDVYICNDTLYKIDSNRVLLSSPYIKERIWCYDGISYNKLLNYNFQPVKKIENY